MLSVRNLRQRRLLRYLAGLQLAYCPLPLCDNAEKHGFRYSIA
jgi:hypothetical protein